MNLAGIRSLSPDRVWSPAMADRVHPREDPPTVGDGDGDTTRALLKDPEIPTKPSLPPPGKPVPPPGTYVVQVPKDQVYRYPPPENSRRFQKYSRRKARRSGCCCCLCWLVGIITLLVLLLAVAAGVFYLVFRPKAPSYTVEKISIKGFNLTRSADLRVSPEFDITVRARNPNKKIGIYYEKGSSVAVSHSGVDLCTGGLPAFYQPAKNVTVFQTALKGSGIQLSSQLLNALTKQQRERKIPLGLALKVPVRIKVGAVKTWTITIRVRCDLTVDKLTADSKLLSKDCDLDVKPWKD